MYEPTIQFTGRLVADPMLTYLRNGNPACNFTVANNPMRKNNQTGKYEKLDPLFIPCSLYTRMAEVAAETLTKGDLVTIMGTVSVNNWAGNDGVTHDSFRVYVTHIGKALPTIKQINNGETQAYGANYDNTQASSSQYGYNTTQQQSTYSNDYDVPF